jgi:hypothetical protein
VKVAKGVNVSQVVCVENIGPREARKRLRLAGVLMLVAVAGSVALVMLQAPRVLRVLLFPPIWGAALGYFQARERTCVVLARRGARNLDRGVEAVSDPAVAGASRRQARKVHLMAVVTGVVATVLLLVLPLQ